MNRRTALKGMAAAVAGATAVPAAQVATASQQVLGNDASIKAIVDQWFALLEAMRDRSISDDEFDALFSEQVAVEQCLPVTPADSFDGVAHKLRWMEYGENADTDEDYIPGKVFRSILADVDRLKA